MKFPNTFPFFLSITLLINLTFFSCRDQSVEPTLYGDLTGIVLHDEHLQPLSNVLVSTTPATKTVLTDSLGQFQIFQIPVGEYSVRGEKEGYAKEVTAISVQMESTTNVTLQLSEQQFTEEQPVFTGDFLPVHGAFDLPVDGINLQWEIEDISGNIQFDVYLYKNDLTNGQIVAENLEVNNYELKDLDYSALYFWQVIAKNGAEISESPVLQMETIAMPDHRLFFTRLVLEKQSIFCSDLDQEPIQITNGVAHYWRPKLSPNHQKIAFISNINLENHLFTMNLDGSDFKQITSIPIAGTDPYQLNYCWSPDGGKLLYMNFDKLYLISENGTGLDLIATAPENFFFASCHWNEATNSIATLITGTAPFENEIRRYYLDGTSEVLVEDLPGTLGQPSLSIDGQTLLFTHDVSGYENQNGRQLDSRIFLLNLNSQNWIDLSVDKVSGMNDLEPQFSPNGGEILFTTTSNDGISPKNILKMDLDGYNRQTLFENAAMVNWQ